MQKSEKSHMGQARASHLRKAVFWRRARPSWTSLLIGWTDPTLSVLSFFSGGQARESHPSRMRSRVALTKCTVLRHHLSSCARSNLNVRLTTSLRPLLAISPTAIHHSKPRLERPSRTTPLSELVLVTIP